jgi:hypothetical protein
METTPYTLILPQENPETFYRILDHLTREIQFKAFISLGTLLRRYQSYLETSINKPGSLQESLTDLLVFGTLWNEHAGRSVNSNRTVVFLLRNMEGLRRIYPESRKLIDPVKGKLLKYITNDSGKGSTAPDRRQLGFFLKWMRAAGEYEYQVVRVERWIGFLQMQDAKVSKNNLHKVLDFAEFFKRRAREVLHSYTAGVNPFLSIHARSYRNREDYFMTSRNEVEYHLNLVGGALLNMAMQKSFSSTREKVIILPGCMRKSSNCKARVGQAGLICTGCTSSCTVNQVNKTFSGDHVKVLVVPHSSGYKKSVSSLTESATGYLGAACALNLLEGGFSLMEKGFPAQCVYLDSPGCNKHWKGNGKCTQINLPRLYSLLNQNTDHQDDELVLIQRTVA